MDCTENLEPDTLVNRLQSGKQNLIERVLSCFDALFRNDFIKIGHKVLNDYNWKADQDIKENLIQESFGDALFAFYNKIRKEGYDDSTGVPIKNSFQVFFTNQIKFKRSRAIKKLINKPEITMENVDNVLDKTNPDLFSTINIFDEDFYETQYKIVIKALDQLGEPCKSLIIYRKLEKLEPEEIARRLGIKEDKINNSVWRCMEKLKEIINNSNN